MGEVYLPSRNPERPWPSNVSSPTRRPVPRRAARIVSAGEARTMALASTPPTALGPGHGSSSRARRETTTCKWSGSRGPLSSDTPRAPRQAPPVREGAHLLPRSPRGFAAAWKHGVRPSRRKPSNILLRNGRKRQGRPTSDCQAGAGVQAASRLPAELILCPPGTCPRGRRGKRRYRLPRSTLNAWVSALIVI